MKVSLAQNLFDISSIISISNFSHSNWYIMYLIVALIWISLMINNSEDLVCVLICYRYLFFGEVSVHIFSHFLIGLFSYSCGLRALYIFWAQVFYPICNWWIFTVTCLFTLWIVSFEDKFSKGFSKGFVNPCLSSFSFINCALVSYLRNICLTQLTKFFSDIFF